MRDHVCGDLEAPETRCDDLSMELIGFHPWPGQDIFLSQFFSPPNRKNGYQRSVRETWKGGEGNLGWIKTLSGEVAILSVASCNRNWR